MDHSEVTRVQAYLRQTFGTDRIKLALAGRRGDSVEVSLGDEFIGVIHRDDEDGGVSYCFNMAILEEDLPTVAELT
ncbi:MAG: DUF3126 family protein [Alphaproteobacteria bacterium]|nr:DUF3126 family protein [Alphaproteobacteria bacterium]